MLRSRRPDFYLIVLGCIGWLVPLGLAGTVLWRYGYFYGADWLAGIPIVMLALTLGIGALPRPMRRKPVITLIILAWTALTICAGGYWMVIWTLRFYS